MYILQIYSTFYPFLIYCRVFLKESQPPSDSFVQSCFANLILSLSVGTIPITVAYTGLNLPHAREKPATSPENFRHLAGEGCQCKRETTYCEEHTKNV